MVYQGTAKKKSSLPRIGFPVSNEEIQKQLLQLKKVPKACIDNSAENNQKCFSNDLALMLKNVIVQRRESGWCDSSSNGSSGRGSRCSQNFSANNKTTLTWSGDDCY